MYYVAKTMEIAGAHSLHLSYESKCEKSGIAVQQRFEK